MATMTRRKFLKSTMTLGAGALLYIYSDGSYKLVLGAPRAVDYTLRVIHTNDHHARIEPQLLSDPVTLQPAQGSTPAVTRLFGGLSRRQTLFKQFRAEAAAVGGNPNILFLDAGDVFQGTLFFNLFNGQADLDFYIDLGYDAFTVGNHEFDKGPQPLVDFVQGVKATSTTPAKPTNFPVLSGNIVTTDPVLAPAYTKDAAAIPGQKIGAWTIKQVGAKKVGIFGLTTPETKVSSSPGPNTSFEDPIVAATRIVPLLRAAGAEFVIALTHIGYSETQAGQPFKTGTDQDLAAQVNGIDLIIGGHSHTPLLPSNTTTLGPVGVTPRGPYPTIVKNPAGKDVPIITDWEWGKWVGDISLGFDSVAGTVAVISGTIYPVWADILPIPAAGQPPRALIPGEKEPIARDAAFDAKLKPYSDAVAVLNNQKIATTGFTVEGGSSFRNRESTGGDLITDAMLARTKNFPFPDGKVPTIAITNSGGIRANIAAGDVTVGSVITVLPFGNTLATVDLTGAQVIAALENGVSQVPGAGRFPQVAGLRFFWSRFGTAAVQKDEVPANTAAVKGNRIQRVEVPKADGTGYESIGLTTVYRVVTNNFQLVGGDGYFVFTTAGDRADPSVGGGTNQFDTKLVLADVVQDYIVANSQNGALVRPAQGRIIGVQVLLPLVAQPAAATAAPTK